MRKLLKFNSVLFFVIAMAGNVAHAQGKVAYVAFNEVMQLMPELKTIQSQMDIYQKDWTDQLKIVNDDYVKKMQEYQAGEKNMTDAARSTKQAELQGIQKRFNDLNTNAQQSVEAKSSQLTKPVVDKVKVAVKAVAKEKGYTYVINSSETDLIVAPDADNILAAVKIKLGLK